MPDLQLPECPCCGLRKSSGKILTVASLLKLQFPDLVWSSGTRCEKYNRTPSISGSSRSGHLPMWNAEQESVAGDAELQDWSLTRARLVVVAAMRAGASGVGYMPEDHAFHFDVKPRVRMFALWKVITVMIEKKRVRKTVYFF